MVFHTGQIIFPFARPLGCEHIQQRLNRLQRVMKPKLKLHLLLTLLACFARIQPAAAQGTAFTYQGHLDNNGNPAGGTYDLTFSLLGVAGGGSAIAGPITNKAVRFTNGLFTAVIDFGPGVLTGATNWLELAVRTNGVSGFTTLAPRQQLTAAPYAVYAENAGSALNAASATTAANAGQVSTNGVTTGAIQDNAVTAVKIAGGQVVKSLTAGAATLFDNVTLVAGNNVTITPAGQTLTIAAAGGGSGPGAAWSLTGNANTTPGVDFLGTTDNQPVEFRANQLRALRLEPGVSGDGAPNVIGGSPLNLVAPGVTGATIGGGGATNYGGAAQTNSVAADFGTIGGGFDNAIQARCTGSTISGGVNNNLADSGVYLSEWSFIGGGIQNSISGSYVSTVTGGALNTIQSSAKGGSTIGGGIANVIQAYSYYDTVAGGGEQYHWGDG